MKDILRLEPVSLRSWYFIIQSGDNGWSNSSGGRLSWKQGRRHCLQYHIKLSFLGIKLLIICSILLWHILYTDIFQPELCKLYLKLHIFKWFRHESSHQLYETDLPWTVVGGATVKFQSPSSKRGSGSSEGAGEGGGGTKLESGTPWVKESRHMESK